MVSDEGYKNLVKLHVDAVLDYAKTLKEEANRGIVP